MKAVELEEYFRNHSFPDSKVKIICGNQNFEIKDIRWIGLENGNEIIIETK